MSTVVVTREKNPHWLLQLIWFALIGWWAGQIWIGVAWLLMVTVVGIPFAVMMLNKLPKVIALRGNTLGETVVKVGEVTVVAPGAQVPQHNILLRAIYFVLVGWWLSAVWMEAAYALCATIIFMPVGFWMFDRVPALVSLRR